MAVGERNRLLGLSDAELLAQCEMDRLRASGPGGQKRNKTESAIRLRHPPSGLMATASESRSQSENRARALRRLREQIALQLREDTRPAASLASEELVRLLRPGTGPASARQRRSPEYLMAIASLLDLVNAVNYSVSEAAKHLGVTTGQLVRFVRRDARLLAKINEQRVHRGLRFLR